MRLSLEKLLRSETARPYGRGVQQLDQRERSEIRRIRIKNKWVVRVQSLLFLSFWEGSKTLDEKREERVSLA